MKTVSCAFTGHRPQSLPFGFNETDSRCIALKRALHDQIINLIETIAGSALPQSPYSHSGISY